MDTNIQTHDLRFNALNTFKNVWLNKKEENAVEVILVGVDVYVGDLVLLTLTTQEQEVDSAWKVVEVQPHAEKSSFKCVLNFEGIIKT